MLKIDNILLTPELYIVSTPIGNLKDITIRALSILKNCDLIACEDTRVTKKLLTSYEIKSKKLISFHEHSSQQKIFFIIETLKKGKSVALVSDAGTPVISDPGIKLIKLAITNKIKVTPIPGASAVTSSLVGSGLSFDKFLFIGFLPNKKNQRINLLNEYKEINSLLIFYESAKRIKETIKDMFSIFGNRKCVIAREMTKYYETFYRGDLNEFKNIKNNLKGEITIILSSPEKKNEELDINDNEIKKIISFTKEKLSTKDLSELLSIIYKKPKKFFYSKLIKSIR
ncbi:MAG: Ribosomal RNA small subunit methyltransferase I [Alphaproteobacteria bacterium MarineAlpha6_Bin6]|nr:MAG: Ribosomal RNA small subunit methyltransferase I [Alphaproteobacteria bacterium MarineAlpha6_Bin6]PPR33790.1 MAG: Ribosomal RNA small subunit methyltransferase I [Alphaproteobacteria bacterium MarineAlpha6_Bin5]|tara:strand:- start:1395 stop:2249 length:855 start_codon:yes stop_codon:yes gene_type:complete